MEGIVANFGYSERIKECIANNDIESWNQWRENNPQILPDLSSERLISADLSGVDFSGANLQSINLQNACLIGADLRGSDLSWANLIDADLRGASLKGARLYNADLRGADLKDADLKNANLKEARLYNADLRDAEFSEGWLSSVNLRDVSSDNRGMVIKKIYDTIRLSPEFSNLSKGIEDYRGPYAASKKAPLLYPVWFATNRKPVDPNDLLRGFGSNREDSGTVNYGKCVVRIPKHHKIGSVGSPWWTLRMLGKDQRLTIDDYALFEESVFWSSINKEIGSLEFDKKTALIYIHGFNVSFDGAAIRAAQLGVDLNVPVTGFYSWPSKGKTISYVADKAAIEGCEKQITQFLVDFAEKSGANSVNIIAHSMGNIGLLRALQDITRTAQDKSKVPFNQIILAAPDIDVQLFSQVANIYKQASRRTTLYVSSKDVALKGSGILNDYQRVGYKPPVTVVDGIDTIDVPRVNLSILGHGYYASAYRILVDIHSLITKNTHPEDRFGLSKAQTANGKLYWVMKS